MSLKVFKRVLLNNVRQFLQRHQRQDTLRLLAELDEARAEVVTLLNNYDKGVT